MMQKLIVILFFSFLSSHSVFAVDSLETQIAQLTKKIPTSNGPNCWNSVLKVSGLVSNLRYSTPEELKFWMTSKYCHKIENPIELKSGDIIRIRERSNELHAMIWLDNETVFSKTTSHIGDNYEQIRSDLIYSTFRVDQAECRLPAKGQSKLCHRWADFYRCELRLKDQVDFEKNNAEYDRISSDTKSLADSLETLLFTFSNESLLHDESVTQMRSELDRIQKNVANLKQENILPFFWKALRLEIDAIQIQLSILKR